MPIVMQSCFEKYHKSAPKVNRKIDYLLSRTEKNRLETGELKRLGSKCQPWTWLDALNLCSLMHRYVGKRWQWNAWLGYTVLRANFWWSFSAKSSQLTWLARFRTRKLRNFSVIVHYLCWKTQTIIGKIIRRKSLIRYLKRITTYMSKSTWTSSMLVLPAKSSFPLQCFRFLMFIYALQFGVFFVSLISGVKKVEKQAKRNERT